MTNNSLLKIIFSLPFTIVLLIGSLLFFQQSTAEAALQREAIVLEVNGVATMQQAGGTKIYRVHPGMKIRQGDQITTGAYSDIRVKISDTEDEITVSERANFLFSDLRYESKHSLTKLNIRRGSAFFSVTPLDQSDDVFQVVTPETQVNVRGTNFVVTVDPITGGSKLQVLSGVLEADSNSNNTPPILVYPTQQIDFHNGIPSDLDDRIVVDLNELTKFVPVLESILSQFNKIDSENNEFIAALREASLKGEVELEDDILNRLSKNFEGLMSSVIHQIMENNKVDAEKLKIILEQLRIDPSDFKDFKPSEPSEEELARAAIRKLEIERIEKKRQEQLTQQRENQQQKDLLQKLQKQKELLEQQNKQAQDAAKKKAEETYLEKLQADKKAEFLERQKQAEEERKRQDEAAAKAKEQLEKPVSPSNPSVEWGDSSPTPEPGPEPNPEIEINQKLADAKAKVPSNPDLYTSESWERVIAALAMQERNIDEKSSKTEAILMAIQHLKKHMEIIPEISKLVIEFGHRHVTANWEPQQGVVKYEVLLNGEVVGESEDMENGFFGNDELVPGTTYTLEIKGLNDAGALVAHTKQTFTTDQELPIEFGIEVKEQTDSITIQWEKLDKDLRYQIYLNDGLVSEITDANTTSFTFENLEPATDYSIRVMAYEENVDLPYAQGTVQASTTTTTVEN